MKKYSVIEFIISGMLILLLGTSFQVVISANIESNSESDYNIVSKTYDPPEWADGEFSGTYGKIVLGKPSVELGWAEGYWSSNPIGSDLFQKGRMEGHYVEWGDEEPVYFMESYSIGFFIYPFFQTITIGTMTDATTGKEKFCIGYGQTGMDGTLNYNSLVINGDNLYFIGVFTEY